jgi:hypothetical protein
MEQIGQSQLQVGLVAALWCCTASACFELAILSPVFTVGSPHCAQHAFQVCAVGSGMGQEGS